MSKILEKLNTDRILSVSAILIGLMTLVVYFIQTRLIIDQQHAGVWPCVELSTTNDYGGTNDKELFNINVNNKGIGPALIKKVEIKFRGKIFSEFGDVFRLITGSSNFINSSLEGRTMASNEIINPVQIPLSIEGYKFAHVFGNHDSVQTKIYYQSVYGKCFVSSGFDTKELPDCSALDDEK